MLERLLNRADLVALGISFGPSYLRTLIAKGRFPRPIRLSPRVLAWPESEIATWIKARSEPNERARPTVDTINAKRSAPARREAARRKAEAKRRKRRRLR